MRYVGYAEGFHDASISIIETDGSVSFASASERYTKLKHEATICPELWKNVNDDDRLIFYEDRSYRTYTKARDILFKEALKDIKIYPSLQKSELKADEYHRHHLSHNASAFYTRPWDSIEDTVMVSVDGSGETDSINILDHNFEPIHIVYWPRSLGSLYTVATKEIGFNLFDEYITMGLSPYGEVEPKLYNLLQSNFDPANAYTGRHKEIILKIIQRMSVITKSDCAATMQQFFEDEVMKIMKSARRFGSKLVYSGGCAQNVVANSKIRELFDDMHICIAPADDGTSLGAAAHSWSRDTGGTHLKWSPYLGHNIDRDINPKEVAKYLSENKVCGVANGRAEFGPRALGNRSLLGDVRYDVKDTVNDIKRRHKFRPFGPAILSEFADDYFDGPMNEYMQYTSIAKHDYDSVTHVDGTARVQVVKPDCESVIRQILEEYYELTGVPMLLNTSLNIRHQPMLNTIEDAIEWEQKYNVRVF